MHQSSGIGVVQLGRHRKIDASLHSRVSCHDDRGFDTGDPIVEIREFLRRRPCVEQIVDHDGLRALGVQARNQVTEPGLVDWSNAVAGRDLAHSLCSFTIDLDDHELRLSGGRAAGQAKIVGQVLDEPDGRGGVEEQRRDSREHDDDRRDGKIGPSLALGCAKASKNLDKSAGNTLRRNLRNHGSGQLSKREIVGHGRGVIAGQAKVRGQVVAPGHQQRKCRWLLDEDFTTIGHFHIDLGQIEGELD